MRKVKIENLTSGLILAEPIFNHEGDLELLSRGIRLTDRHIALLKKLDVVDVKIVDQIEELDEEYSNEELLESIEIKNEEEKKQFEKFVEDLEELEDSHYKSNIRSAVNRQMEINVLTGEGNVPIDVKHKKVIEETKLVFESLKDSNEIDIDKVRSGLKTALPDMIRNSDVLMRLKQLEEGDDYTFEHSLRVSILAANIGKWLGYGDRQLEDLTQAALLFDIGKLKFPEFILKSTKKFSGKEFEIIKKHAQFSYSILLKTKGISSDVKFGVLHHHERIDGSGYPFRIKGLQIHEYAKIIMVCDTFDAMTHDRPYKKKVSPFQAAEYIAWNSGSTFDPKICYVFLSNLAQHYMGKRVLLNTGEEGIVAYVDTNLPNRPIVKVGEKMIDLIKEKDIQIVALL